MEDKQVKHIYHQIDAKTVAYALSFFLAGAAGISLKDVPKNVIAQEFLDSLINNKVDVKGEFGIAKLAAMLKTMLMKLFVDEMGLNGDDALQIVIQIMTVAIEQLTRFVNAGKSEE